MSVSRTRIADIAVPGRHLQLRLAYHLTSALVRLLARKSLIAVSVLGAADERIALILTALAQCRCRRAL